MSDRGGKWAVVEPGRKLTVAELKGRIRAYCKVEELESPGTGQVPSIALVLSLHLERVRY